MYATINYLLQWKSISLAQTIGTVLKPISESGSAHVPPSSSFENACTLSETTKVQTKAYGFGFKTQRRKGEKNGHLKHIVLSYGTMLSGNRR